MAVDIRRVSYAMNSALEDSGKDGYFLDIFVSRDKEVLVDRHESFKSVKEFMAAIEEALPVLADIPTERDILTDTRAEFC